MWNSFSMMKPTPNNLTHWVVGAGPLVRQMADEIGLIALINRMVTWDPVRTKVSPGERIFAMVLAWTRRFIVERNGLLRTFCYTARVRRSSTRRRKSVIT